MFVESVSPQRPSKQSLHRSMEVTGWVYDPNGRGTASIITSCVLTLGICVFTALHLNIPPHKEPRLRYWIRNLQWALLGILIPELVVLAAWRQWTSARGLTKEIKNLLQENEAFTGACQSLASSKGIEAGRRNYNWTVLHSYYAGMGGFAFEVEQDTYDEQEFIPPGITRLTLTTHGVVLLARCGHLPDISSDELSDKSKTDGLAKAVAALQAGWMLIQTIARLIYNLPISLLEVNTVAHVFCALIIYILWWEKPREVYEPTILQGQWTRQIIAYMFMSSRISGNEKRKWFRLNSWIKPELKDLVYIEPPLLSDVTVASSATCEDQPHENTASDLKISGMFCNRMRHQDTPKTIATKRTVRWNTSIHVSNPQQDIKAHPNLNSEPSAPFVKRFGPESRALESSHTLSQQAVDMEFRWTKPLPDVPVAISEEPSRRRRHALAVEAIELYPAIKERFQIAEKNQTAGLLEPEVSQLVVSSAGNWPADHLTGRLRGQTMGMCLWFASMIYGGIHIAAWHEYFPSQAEQLMWRLSSVYIACSGGFWFLLNVLAFLCPWAAQWFRNYREARLHWLQLVLLGFGAVLCGLMYIFARTFLVVGALISLRKVPAGVYKTPQWADIIPHL